MVSKDDFNKKKAMATKQFYVTSAKFDLTETQPSNSLRKKETEIHTEELARQFDQLDQNADSYSFFNVKKVENKESGDGSTQIPPN